jgi:imidazolonepropionase-like amidohydrolase
MLKRFVVWLGLCWLCAVWGQDTPYRLPQVYAIRGAKIVPVSSAPIEQGTIVVRDGVIVAVGPADKTPIPPDAELIEGSGLTVYPGFIDGFCALGMPSQANDPAYATYERGNTHPNAQVRPERQASVLFQPDSGTLDRWRRAGFVAALVVPPHGTLTGRSALMSLSDGTHAEQVIRADFGVHLNLRGRALGEGFGSGYPSSLMGAIALVRQTFYDAQHQAQMWAIYQKSPNGKPRPPLNRALDALQPVLKREVPLVALANSAQDILRVLRIADEFGLRVILAGGQEAAKVADLLAKRKIPVLLSMEMPEPLRTYDPLNPPTLVSLRNRALAYQNAALLYEKGVTFAFTTEGLSDPQQLLRNIRTATANGLPKEAALQALTIVPARLFGVEAQLGSIEKGKLASFVVVEGELFEPRARLRYLFVDGKQYRLDESSSPGGAPVPRFRRPRDWDASETASAHEASCCYEHSRCDDSCDTLTAGIPQDPTTPEVGARAQEPERREQPSGERQGEEPPRMPRVQLEPLMPPPADEHNTWLIRNATVWTLTTDAPLPETDVLIVDGKIRAVGKNLTTPPNARVIDATGKHLTPGIIDCHSHTAISGGVNEGTNICTAEVRIQDVLNPEDVNIYRQLAGGVTAANVLHGSANVIGGQNAVVKWRWGKSAEEMLFKEAPPGIKFALGENVKRSNFTPRADAPRRYPATRMGVEQVVRERFLAALDYQRQQEEYRAGKRAYPPARDLQLDALLEVLQGKRLIHCHSYRQDEILMLIRVCEEFGVRIATFQHVLEGYKVAKEIAQHGAGGSAFSDWWAYKVEAYDAIPYDGALMAMRGVVVSFNSDSNELARRLNTEATKAIKYGDMSEVEALKFVTLNAAIQLGIDRYVGSIEPGKHADLAIWSDHPLSVYARCEKTFIDGVLYFDIERDREWRAKREQERQEYLKAMRPASLFERSAEEPSSPRPDTPPRATAAGVWKGVVKGSDFLPPEGIGFTLTLQQEGGRLTGTLETMLGTVTLSDVQFDPANGTLQFTLQTPDGMSFSVSGTIEGDRMTGTLSAMGVTLTLEAQRTPQSRS